MFIPFYITYIDGVVNFVYLLLLYFPKVLIFSFRFSCQFLFDFALVFHRIILLLTFENIMFVICRTFNYVLCFSWECVLNVGQLFDWLTLLWVGTNGYSPVGFGLFPIDGRLVILVLLNNLKLLNWFKLFYLLFQTVWGFLC